MSESLIYIAELRDVCKNIRLRIPKGARTLLGMMIAGWVRSEMEGWRQVCIYESGCAENWATSIIEGDECATTKLEKKYNRLVDEWYDALRVTIEPLEQYNLEKLPLGNLRHRMRLGQYGWIGWLPRDIRGIIADYVCSCTGTLVALRRLQRAESGGGPMWNILRRDRDRDAARDIYDWYKRYLDLCVDMYEAAQ